MLNYGKSHNSQRGTVLVIALLLLLVLTILGVASMSGTIMQERMAGNVNLQTLAFNSASAGVATSIDFANPTTWGTDAGGNPRTCLRDGLSGCEPNQPWCWRGGWTTFQNFDAPNAPPGTTVQYRQRVGCFEAEDALDHWDNPADVPLQLLVLNQGAVCTGAACLADGSNFLAVREVEVRVETRGGNPDCLIEVGSIAGVPCGQGKGGGGCPVQMPASGQGGGDGSRIDARPNGCPIRTSDDLVRSEMLRQLTQGSDRTGWYQPQPAVVTGDPDPFWMNGNAIALAANAIKIGVRGYQAGFEDDDGNLIFEKCKGRILTGDVSQCPSDDVMYPITYVAGTLDLNPGGGSGCRVLGSVFVEEDLRFRGQTTYGGDFILLGGLINLNGMGSQISQGLIKMVNLHEPSPSRSVLPAYNLSTVELRPSTQFNISGMGGSQIRSEDCGIVQDRWVNLNQCLQTVFDLEENLDFDDGAGGFVNWFNSGENNSPMLNSPGFGGALVRFPIPRCVDIVSGGGTRDVIASWREYLDRERW